MKTQTWLPKKRPIARTLADVPSSREKPVLCWNVEGDRILNAFVHCQSVCIVHADGFTEVYLHAQQATKMRLYNQPHRPTKLEDVPDRWIVRFRLDGERIDNDTVHAFRESGKWLGLDGKLPYCMSDLWQLTDCIAELVEVEVEVMT